MEKQVRLRGKDGREFVGSPKECARVLMSDALEVQFRSGSPHARWMAEDFCNQFGIDAHELARDLDPKRILTY